MKKLVSLLLAVAMLATLLGTVSAVAEDAPNGTYQMFMRSTYIDWIKELKWYDEAEARTGIHVDYVYGPEEFDDVYSEVDQRIISDTLPDAVMTKLTQTNVYGPEGVFVDLAPYIAKYAPNLQAYIDANPAYKALVTNAEGAIYGLCKETPIFADLIGYRVDHFEKAGIDPETVVTVADFTDALRKLKAYWGAENPNYYPLTGRDSAMRFAAWFNCPSTISTEESNGVYIAGHYKDGSFDILSENAYGMIETMKTWYDEGLINPEWVAGTFSEGDWEAAMLNGNGSVFYDYYTRAQWFMVNGGPDNDPDYKMGVLNFLKNEDGSVIKVTASKPYNDECVTAVSAKCDEDKIKTILTFIDFFYSEEGQVLANYGVEGESFKVDEKGEKVFIVDYNAEEATPAGEKRWSFLSDRLTVCKPVDNEAFFKWNDALIAEAAGRLFTEENMLTAYDIKLTDDQSMELSNLVASVYDAQVAGMTAFVNGTNELTEDNWKAFQDQMIALGLSRIEEIQLEAFQAQFAD